MNKHEVWACKECRGRGRGNHGEFERQPARRTPSSVVQVGAAEGNGPGQDQGPTWNNLGSACLGLVSFSFCTVLIFLLYCTDFPSVLC